MERTMRTPRQTCLHAGRIAGGHHDHRHPDCVAVAGGPGGPRSGPAIAVPEPSQADRARPAQLREPSTAHCRRGLFWPAIPKRHRQLRSLARGHEHRPRKARHELDAANPPVPRTAVPLRSLGLHEERGRQSGRGRHATSTSIFCPTRRSGTRPNDRFVMFPSWAGRGPSSGWTKGGNDYAGCMGAQNAYANPTTSNLARTILRTDLRLRLASDRTDAGGTASSACAGYSSQTSPRDSTKSPTACRRRS